MKGDVWTPDYYKEWPYCIELKHYKEISFNNMLTAKSNEVFKFWDQAVREAEEMKKIPLVIFRWDRSKNYIVWQHDLDLKNQIEVKSFKYNIKIGLLDDWLKECDISLANK